MTRCCSEFLIRTVTASIPVGVRFLRRTVSPSPTAVLRTWPPSSLVNTKSSLIDRVPTPTTGTTSPLEKKNGKAIGCRIFWSTKTKYLAMFALLLLVCGCSQLLPFPSDAIISAFAHQLVPPGRHSIPIRSLPTVANTNNDSHFSSSHSVPPSEQDVFYTSDSFLSDSSSVLRSNVDNLEDVLVLTADARLYCYNLKDSKPKWSFLINAAGLTSSSPLSLNAILPPSTASPTFISTTAPVRVSVDVDSNAKVNSSDSKKGKDERAANHDHTVRLVSGFDGSLWFIEDGKLTPLPVSVKEVVARSPFSHPLFPGVQFVGARLSDVFAIDYNDGTATAVTAWQKYHNLNLGQSAAQCPLHDNRDEKRSSEKQRPRRSIQLGSTVWTVRAVDSNSLEQLWQIEWVEVSPVGKLGRHVSSEQDGERGRVATKLEFSGKELTLHFPISSEGDTPYSRRSTARAGTPGVESQNLKDSDSLGGRRKVTFPEEIVSIFRLTSEPFTGADSYSVELLPQSEATSPAAHILRAATKTPPSRAASFHLDNFDGSEGAGVMSSSTPVPNTPTSSTFTGVPSQTYVGLTPPPEVLKSIEQWSPSHKGHYIEATTGRYYVDEYHHFHHHIHHHIVPETDGSAAVKADSAYLSTQSLPSIKHVSDQHGQPGAVILSNEAQKNGYHNSCNPQAHIAQLPHHEGQQRVCLEEHGLTQRLPAAKLDDQLLQQLNSYYRHPETINAFKNSHRPTAGAAEDMSSQTLGSKSPSAIFHGAERMLVWYTTDFLAATGLGDNYTLFVSWLIFYFLPVFASVFIAFTILYRHFGIRNSTTVDGSVILSGTSVHPINGQPVTAIGASHTESASSLQTTHHASSAFVLPQVDGGIASGHLVQRGQLLETQHENISLVRNSISTLQEQPSSATQNLLTTDGNASLLRQSASAAAGPKNITTIRSPNCSAQATDIQEVANVLRMSLSTSTTEVQPQVLQLSTTGVSVAQNKDHVIGHATTLPYRVVSGSSNTSPSIMLEGLRIDSSEGLRKRIGSGQQSRTGDLAIFRSAAEMSNEDSALSLRRVDAVGPGSANFDLGSRLRQHKKNSNHYNEQQQHQQQQQRGRPSSGERNTDPRALIPFGEDHSIRPQSSPHTADFPGSDDEDTLALDGHLYCASFPSVHDCFGSDSFPWYRQPDMSSASVMSTPRAKSPVFSSPLHYGASSSASLSRHTALSGGTDNESDNIIVPHSVDSVAAASAIERKDLDRNVVPAFDWRQGSGSSSPTVDRGRYRIASLESLDGPSSISVCDMDSQCLPEHGDYSSSSHHVFASDSSPVTTSDAVRPDSPADGATPESGTNRKERMQKVVLDDVATDTARNAVYSNSVSDHKLSSSDSAALQWLDHHTSDLGPFPWKMFGTAHVHNSAISARTFGSVATTASQPASSDSRFKLSARGDSSKSKGVGDSRFVSSQDSVTISPFLTMSTSESVDSVKIGPADNKLQSVHALSSTRPVTGFAVGEGSVVRNNWHQTPSQHSLFTHEESHRPMSSPPEIIKSSKIPHLELPTPHVVMEDEIHVSSNYDDHQSTGQQKSAHKRIAKSVGSTPRGDRSASYHERDAISKTRNANDNAAVQLQTPTSPAAVPALWSPRTHRLHQKPSLLSPRGTGRMKSNQSATVTAAGVNDNAVGNDFMPQSVVDPQCPLAKALENGRLQRQFEDIEIIGRGGFGIVYRARHRLEPKTTANYAIKLVNLQLRGDDDISNRRHLREVSANRDLFSRHVVRYYTWWCEEPQFLPKDPYKRIGGINRPNKLQHKLKAPAAPQVGLHPQADQTRDNSIQIPAPRERRASASITNNAQPCAQHSSPRATRGADLSNRGLNSGLKPIEPKSNKRNRASSFSTFSRFLGEGILDELDEEIVEGSQFDTSGKPKAPKGCTGRPLESSDFVCSDEERRSIRTAFTVRPEKVVNTDFDSIPNYAAVNDNSVSVGNCTTCEAELERGGGTDVHAKSQELSPFSSDRCADLGDDANQDNESEAEQQILSDSAKSQQVRSRRIRRKGPLSGDRSKSGSGDRDESARDDSRNVCNQLSASSTSSDSSSSTDENKRRWLDWTDASDSDEPSDKATCSNNNARASIVYRGNNIGGVEVILENRQSSPGSCVSSRCDTQRRSGNKAKTWEINMDEDKHDAAISEEVRFANSSCNAPDNDNHGNVSSSLHYQRNEKCDYSLQVLQPNKDTTTVAKTGCSKVSSVDTPVKFGNDPHTPPSVAFLESGRTDSSLGEEGSDSMRNTFDTFADGHGAQDNPEEVLEEGGPPGGSSTVTMQTKYPVVLLIQMELCSGLTLRQWLDARIIPLNRYRWTKEMDLFKQLIKGLRDIHAKGIVHRDLKPENVFVCERTLLLKIGDFGLARFVEAAAEDSLQVVVSGTSEMSKATATDLPRNDSLASFRGQVIGTPAYTAPEGGAYCTEKADVFSAGLILLEMLCPPFSTYMERNKTIEKFRATQEVPRHIAAMSAVHHLLLAMTFKKPEDRLSADEVYKAAKTAVSSREAG